MTQDEFIPVHSSALSYNQQGQKQAKSSKLSDKAHVLVPKTIVVSCEPVGPDDCVAATRAFCDKIRLAGWIEEDTLQKVGGAAIDGQPELAELWIRIGKALRGGELSWDPGTKFKYIKNDDYISGKLRLGPSHASVFVGIGKGSKNKEAKRFRLALEFNPRLLGPDGIAALETLVGHLFEHSLSFDRWLAAARVPVIDAAIDFINLDVCDTILRSGLQMEIDTKWSGFFDRNGRIQTWSLLGSKSKRGKRRPILVLYDKRRQLLALEKTPMWDGAPHSRLEVRIKQGKTLLRGLGKLSNPFSQVSVGHAGLVAQDVGDGFRLFFSATRWAGTHPASLLIGPEHRAKWMARATYGDAPFWQHQKSWDGWRKSLIEDGLWDWVVRASKANEQLNNQTGKN